MLTTHRSTLVDDPNLQAAGGAPKKEPAVTGESRKPTPPVELKGVKVMVIDDDAASAKLFSVVLVGEGYEVKAVSSAEDGLTLLQTFQPRLIVVDLILPLMSGLLFTQRLKADPSMQNIIIIAVTAFNGSEAERIVREAGCAAYVRKPIDPLAFIQLVATELGGVT